MHNLVAKVAKGNTFVEVGGLWGTKNETVSTAHNHGATKLAMVDVYPEDHKLWGQFRERLAGLGIDPAKVRCASDDFLGIDGDYFADVICCVGVFYHLPHPLKLLEKLHRMANKYVVFGSSVTETVIENDKGRLEVPDGGVLFIPALSDRERDILRAHWKGIVIGLTQPGKYEVTQTTGRPGENYDPWWWLPTPHALRAMIKMVGFKILEEQEVPGMARNYLLQKRDYAPKSYPLY